MPPNKTWKAERGRVLVLPLQTNW